MKRELRSYQKEGKAKVYNSWMMGKKNVLLVFATGLGKTVTFCNIVKEMSIDCIFGEQYPSLIQVHRKELLSQISLTLSEMEIPHNLIAPTAVIRQIIMIQRAQTGRQWYKHDAPIHVGTVDTILSKANRYEAIFSRIKLWITDEAAHVLADNKWGRAIKLFPNAIGLGVTATPRRLDKKGLGSGEDNDGVFDEIVLGPQTSWGISEGYLSGYLIRAPKGDYEKFLGSASTNTSDYSATQMIAASNQSQIVGDVVEKYKEFANGKQAILFATDIGTANRMERQFDEAGIPAKCLSSHNDDRTRFEFINKFKSKEIKILINVDLFDEGLDVPGVEVVILARPTMSLSKYLQMVGRVLRPFYAKGYNLDVKDERLQALIKGDKPKALIIDHVGNVGRHGIPCKKREWSLERPTRARPVESLIRVCTNCSSVYDRVDTHCPFCGTEAFKITREGAGMRTPPEQVDGDLFLIDPDTIRELEDKAVLESPEEVSRRVTLAAGTIAGKSAFKKQVERIETQTKLKEAIALWAGQQKSLGLDDREIHKMFYIKFQMTILEAIGMKILDMKNLIEDIIEGLSNERTGSTTKDSASSVEA